MDFAFADVVATSTDRHLGAIRLAWWRERLEELDGNKHAPAEPRLRSVERDLIPRGFTGKALSQLEDAWQPLLAPFPWSDDAAEGLKLRGEILFGIGADLLNADRDSARYAGAIWSLADGALHCSDDASRVMLEREALATLRKDRLKVPDKARSMTVLGVLGAVDVAGGGNLARGFAAVRHRLFGAFPR